jgi:hypothetical protein
MLQVIPWASMRFLKTLSLSPERINYRDRWEIQIPPWQQVQNHAQKLEIESY